MALPEAPNPVAPTTAEQITIVHQQIDKLKALWAKETGETQSPKWYQFWKRPTAIHTGIIFLMEALDFVVQAVDSLALKGAEKKGIVLNILRVIYDTTVAPALPLLLKPVGSAVKTLIIDVVLSNLIDFTVKKYHNAIWGSDLPPGAVIITTNLGQRAA